MELDFSPLYALTATDQDSQSQSSGVQKEEKHYNTLEKIQRDRLLYKELRQHQQQNMDRTADLRLEISQGITEGESPIGLLLKALECVCLLTGDELTFIQYKKDIASIYGWGLRDPDALKMELEEVQERLAMLTRPALTANSTPEALARIEKAVEAHRGLEKRLQAELDAVPDQN